MVEVIDVQNAFRRFFQEVFNEGVSVLMVDSQNAEDFGMIRYEVFKVASVLRMLEESEFMKFSTFT